MSDYTVTQEEVFEYLGKALDKARSSSYRMTNSLPCVIMIELIKAGYADFLLLKDEYVQEWWHKTYSIASEKLTEFKKKSKVYELQMAGYERLSPQERRVLGIKKPSPPTLDYII